MGFNHNEKLWQRRHFLYVMDQQAVGYLAVEQISFASLALDNGTTILAAQDSKAALLGIVQIWVHKKFQRQQIATRMLDAVRVKYFYGMTLPKTKCAFSQPTQQGIAFARAYVDPAPVLVYDISTETTTNNSTHKKLDE